MQRMRIVSVVEDTWGCGIVYGDESQQKIKDSITDAFLILMTKTASSYKSEPATTETQELLRKKERVRLQEDSFPQNIDISSKTSLQKNDEYDVYERNDINEDETDSNYSFTYLQASLFATVLEDTLMELRTLVECNNELRVAKTGVDMGMLIAHKYSVVQPATIDELDAIDPQLLDCDAYKLNKLDADRKYFMDVFLTIYKEMTLSKTFVALEDYVNNIISKENARIFIFDDEAKNRMLRRELNKQLRQRRNHITSVVYDADSTIERLKMLLEDAPLNAEIRSRYVDNWQLARTEQHLQTIGDHEAVPTRVIDYYKRRTDYEQRVHSEVELLTNIRINETLAKVESWMNKYDKDMEALDLKIQIKKNDYQDMLDRRLQFEETIETHDKMMKEWIEFKEIREKARQYHKKMTDSAVIVQAWWRGLLVRRQLGPFKVVKKKGGAPDAKKKK